jgi:L-rhamnonate dehydratase
MKITDLVVIEVAGETERQGRKVPCSTYFLEVRTDEGATGMFGPVDNNHLYILRSEMRGMLLGQDPLAIEKIWDLMLRSNRHSQSGYYMMAMSAVDCALWDLKGKALGAPVYRLLGGPVRKEIPAYASMLGFSLEPKQLAKVAGEYKQLGYQAQKWFFGYGPNDGEDGVRKNVETVRVLRETLGDDYPIMLDAFHGWDVPYSVAVGKRIAEFRPAWLEEPVPSDRISAMKTIRAETGIPLATGEHTYGRWQVETLLDAQAVDDVQSDPDWCGGISELMKIAAICSAHDVPLCPHGHSLHASLHVAGALPQSVQPWVEFLILHQQGKQHFLKGYLEPQAGMMSLPDTPGLGIELDPAKVKSRKELP